MDELASLILDIFLVCVPWEVYVLSLPGVLATARIRFLGWIKRQFLFELIEASRVLLVFDVRLE